MQRSGKARIVGSFELCVDAAGSVSHVALLKSSGFAAYDDRIVAGLHTWRYRPYVVDGTGVPVCTAGTFIYSPSP